MAAAATDGSTTPVDDMSDADVRVAVFRILADPATGAALRAAAEEALDDGMPEALRAFLEHGRRDAGA
ncbi:MULTISPECIES: hypothetical protein [Streptomyces]|uniref:hypothetical protein n=1 Tax=Streptomyces TaxID=1883 RepID=UPI00182892E2|nr:hypothetical protein [Streptomyces murinus]MBA9049939.1 hypothetical protein [Streptomyces murinus]